MTMNINYKLYALLITIFMLFNLSCEDDYPLIFENNSTYSLIIDTSVSGGDIDFNDGGEIESTIVTATLYEISNNQLLPKSGVPINFTVTLDEDVDQSNLPSLDGLDSNNSATTDADGNVILTWLDAGYVGNVELDCSYTDNNGTIWVADNMAAFEVFSIYQKITDLSPRSTTFDDIELSNGETSDNNFGVIVKENSSPVAGAMVYIVDPLTIDDSDYEPSYLDYLYFTSGESAITNSDGEAIFNVRLIGGDALTNALSLSDNNTLNINLTAYVEDVNLVADDCLDGSNDCNDCCGITCNDQIENCIGKDKSTNVTISISSPAVSQSDTYNAITSIELILDPDLINIDNTPGADQTDSSDSDDTTTDDSSETSNNNSSLPFTTLTAQVRDNLGSGLENIPVTFSQTNANGSSNFIGTFTANNILTGSDGVAQTTLQNIFIPDEVDVYEIIITASVIDPSDPSLTLFSSTQSLQIGYQTAFNIDSIDPAGFDYALVQGSTIINNVTTNHVDTLKVNFVDSYGAPIPNVPVQFTLLPLCFPKNSENCDYVGNIYNVDENENISYSQQWSNDAGQARIIYELTPGDLVTYANQIINPEIAISIGHTESNFPHATESWTLEIEGDNNVERDVAQFDYRDNDLPGTPNFVFLTNTTDTLRMEFIAKDEFGVGVGNVPIQYEIFGSNLENLNRDEVDDSLSYGLLLDAMTFTCIIPPEEEELQDDEIDEIDIITECPPDAGIPTGTSWTSYINEITTVPTQDSIRAFIKDPITNEELFADTVIVTTIPPANQLTSLFSYAIPETILMDSLNVVYCDTITTIASNAQGESLQNIVITYSLAEEDRDLGYISDYTAITDTIPNTDQFGSRINFCTYPNITLDGGTEIVNISIQSVSDPVYTNEIEIQLIEDLPECPDCEASVTLVSEYNELPALDNTIFTSVITATVIDSTENPVPENTLVQFQSLTENDEGELVQIGSIEPYKFTDSLGIASAIFNMESDAGLAQIIATAPAYNLADTVYVNLTSTQASSIELTPPFPFEIMVQGGGGVEATGLEVLVKDATENLVTEPFIVRYQILPSAPQGVYLNEADGNNYLECIEATNGIATATLNSGTQPGSVPVKIELFELVQDQELTDDFCQNLVYGDPEDSNNGTGIAALESVPVTVVTGPPEFGQINYSYVDITPIGGGTYDVPLSVNIWDFYSNPVADSTNVYIWVEGIAEPWDGINNIYEFGDTIKWGGTDALGNVIEVDSLLYIYNLDNTSDFYGNISPENNPEVFGVPMWRQVPQPASVIGQAQIGMEAPDGQSYPGIAWSSVRYGTSNMFDNTVIKALTYKANGEKLVIDGRDSHNGEPLVLPFQPGVLALGADVQFWDFSVFGDVGINDLDDTVAVNISANLTDYYQYPVDNGRVVLSAPGANINAVCDPVDTDNDGFVGCCNSFDILDNETGLPSAENTGNGDGVCDEISEFDTCSVCVANGGVWIPDGAQDDPNTPNIPLAQINGPNDQADDTAYGRTNGDGTIIWNISYSEALNPGDGQDPETYEDFTSTVTGQLIDPLQTASEGVDILLIKSEQNEN